MCGASSTDHRFGKVGTSRTGLAVPRFPQTIRHHTCGHTIAPARTQIENAYYAAKGDKESDPEAALRGFLQVCGGGCVGVSTAFVYICVWVCFFEVCVGGCVVSGRACPRRWQDQSHDVCVYSAPASESIASPRLFRTPISTTPPPPKKLKHKHKRPNQPTGGGPRGGAGPAGGVGLQGPEPVRPAALCAGAARGTFMVPCVYGR